MVMPVKVREIEAFQNLFLRLEWVLILGSHCLKKNRVQIHFNPPLSRIRTKDIPLEIGVEIFALLSEEDVKLSLLLLYPVVKEKRCGIRSISPRNLRVVLLEAVVQREMICINCFMLANTDIELSRQ